MQLQKSLLPSTVLIALSVTPMAYAETPEEAPKPVDKFYVEGGYTVYDEMGPNYSEYQDISSDALTVRLGYSVNRYIDIEGEFNASADSSDSLFSRDVKRSAGVYVKANLPVADKIDLFARLGATSTDTETNGRYTYSYTPEGATTGIVPFTYEDNDPGIAGGLGATYDLTDKVYLRGDYQRMTTTADDFETASVAIGIRF